MRVSQLDQGGPLSLCTRIYQQFFLLFVQSAFQDANLNAVLVCPSMPHVYSFIYRTNLYKIVQAQLVC